MYKSFRPGDIVLARVLTLHTQTYLMSTAENELGVVFAKSESGKTNILCIKFVHSASVPCFPSKY